MKLYCLLAFLLLSFTPAFAQLSIHSIDFQAPLSSNLSQNNALSLGVTLKIPEKDKMLELGLLGFGDNGRKYTTGLGSYNDVSYYDRNIDAFTRSERPKYMLQSGDSVLGQFQSISRDALGLRVGLRSDRTLGKIPFYTSLSASFIFAKSSYNRSEFYEKYDTSTTNQNHSNFENFETSWPPTNYTNEEIYSFIPQVSAQLGVLLSLTERIKVIPKLVVNTTYPEYLSYNLAGATSVYRVIDFSTVASFQLSYILK